MKYTKEQLQGMTDKQINCALSSLLHDSEIVGNIHGGDFFVAKTSEGVEYYVDTYCNNPNDIMPLAFEHGIHFGPQHDCWYAIYDASILSENLIEVEDKSPLRAIACCLVLVLQSKE